MVEAFVPLQYLGGENLIKAITPGAQNNMAFLWEYANPQEKWARGRKFYVYGTNLAKAHQLHANLRRRSTFAGRSHPSQACRTAAGWSSPSL